MSKEYLGDSVYIDVDADRRVVLTTENGRGPSNTIILEPEVVIGLTAYLERMVEEAGY